MTKFVRPLMFVVVAMSLLLAACGAPAPAEPVTVVQTQVVEKVVTPTADPNKPAELPAGSVQINGEGIGSGGGKKAIVDGTVDFAGSDSLLADADYTKGKDLQMYPTIAGAVVVIYNVKFNAPKTAAVGAGTPTPAAPTYATLILDRQTLVDIYNGKVNKWNDPAIVKLNPDLKDALPSAGITVAHRSDGSGTTEIFTKALTSFSKDWTAGGAQSVEWPTDKAGNGVGGKGNAGVAAVVINTPNSLGYVELGYAKSNSLSFASLINQAGKTIVPSNAGVQAAMTEFVGTFTDKLTNVIVDGKSPDAYPIAGYTYLILHTTSMTDCVKAAKILEFFKWALTDPTALKRTDTLGYAALPDAVRTAVFTKFGEVTCSGAPVFKP